MTDSEPLLPNLQVYDCRPTLADLRQVVLEGLHRKPKQLPPWLFYDQRGSKLFDQIVAHPDYYPPDAERTIYQLHGAAIARELGRELLLIEPGAGSCLKIRWLLAAGIDVRRYLPIEVSGDNLIEHVYRLATDYPQLYIQALIANYREQIVWPPDIRQGTRRTVVFFPGSSIGNYELDEAQELLHFFRHWIPDEGGLLIGVDNPKDIATLERAYNDRDGLTAAFNLNALERIAQAFGVPNLPAEFTHEARYNEAQQRIEMHLVARRKIRFKLGEDTIRFEAGESIHTENSYKYTAEQFEALARQAAFEAPICWRDERERFTVFYFPAG